MFGLNYVYLKLERNKLNSWSLVLPRVRIIHLVEYKDIEQKKSKLFKFCHEYSFNQLIFFYSCDYFTNQFD